MLFSHDIAQVIFNEWLAIFLTVGKIHNIPPERLLAIASRESAMRNIVGDSGHGFGLMQIDIRTDPSVKEMGLEPAWNISRGAELLNEKRSWILANQNQEIKLTHSAGIVSFIVPEIKDDFLLDRLAIAMYNVGAWAVYHFTKNRDIDYSTTGRNYSADVLGRERIFSDWIYKLKILAREMMAYGE